MMMVHSCTTEEDGATMNITTVGIDLAKNIFHLHGVNANGKVVLQKRLSRDRLREWAVNEPPCRIGMEACSGSNYWARVFVAQGHDVRMMSPQFVKPYVKSNKNDRNDAEAICEAVTRPAMRFVRIFNRCIAFAVVWWDNAPRW
jgi:transposase